MLALVTREARGNGSQHDDKSVLGLRHLRKAAHQELKSLAQPQ